MNSRQRNVMTKYCGKFVETVNPTEILPYLPSLTDMSKEEIIGYTSRSKAALELHAQLLRKPMFNELLAALRNPTVKMDFLADLLDPPADSSEKKFASVPDYMPTQPLTTTYGSTISDKTSGIISQQIYVRTPPLHNASTESKVWATPKLVASIPPFTNTCTSENMPLLPQSVSSSASLANEKEVTKFKELFLPSDSFSETDVKFPPFQKLPCTSQEPSNPTYTEQLNTNAGMKQSMMSTVATVPHFTSSTIGKPNEATLAVTSFLSRSPLAMPKSNECNKMTQSVSPSIKPTEQCLSVTYSSGLDITGICKASPCTSPTVAVPMQKLDNSAPKYPQCDMATPWPKLNVGIGRIIKEFDNGNALKKPDDLAALLDFDNEEVDAIKGNLRPGDSLTLAYVDHYNKSREMLTLERIFTLFHQLDRRDITKKIEDRTGVKYLRSRRNCATDDEENEERKEDFSSLKNRKIIDKSSKGDKDVKHIFSQKEEQVENTKEHELLREGAVNNAGKSNLASIDINNEIGKSQIPALVKRAKQRKNKKKTKTQLVNSNVYQHIHDSEKEQSKTNMTNTDKIDASKKVENKFVSLQKINENPIKFSKQDNDEIQFQKEEMVKVVEVVTNGQSTSEHFKDALVALDVPFHSASFDFSSDVDKYDYGDCVKSKNTWQKQIKEDRTPNPPENKEEDNRQTVKDVFKSKTPAVVSQPFDKKDMKLETERQLFEKKLQNVENVSEILRNKDFLLPLSGVISYRKETTGSSESLFEDSVVYQSSVPRIPSFT